MIACDGVIRGFCAGAVAPHDRQLKFDRATPFAPALIELAQMAFLFLLSAPISFRGGFCLPA